MMAATWERVRAFSSGTFCNMLAEQDRVDCVVFQRLHEPLTVVRGHEVA
jgi:hypothetical protein